VPLTDAQIDEAIARYRREWDRYRKLVEFVAEACRAMVSENAIPATVQWRAKDPGRLRGKIARKREELDCVDDVFSGIRDFAGVRIATYVEDDRERVVSEIAERFDGPGGGEVHVEVRDKPEPSFYRATHCVVVLRPDDLNERLANLEDTPCEIQVCSLLAHVWNEIEHDRVYKPLTGELSDDERAALAQLGHLVRAGDGAITTLLDATDRRLKQNEGRFLDQWDFVARMRDRFPDARDFGTHSGPLYEELVGCGYDSPQEVEDGLLDGDADGSAARRALEDLQAYLAERGDDVVRLDARTSDVLLMPFLARHAGDVLRRHPAGRGRGRPPRIASVARRYVDWQGVGAGGSNTSSRSTSPRPRPARSDR
jgi:ppGpp synthetase/RelA/SpoT-type nucleotidyltranferase